MCSGNGQKYLEKKNSIILGSLHTEVTLWKTIGDFLEDSGWTAALMNQE